MIIQDNVIKEYLKNVYFICGTPCGGKTTISRVISKKYGIPVYDIDEAFDGHQAKSDPAFQPTMNKNFRDADEFFGRSVETATLVAKHFGFVEPASIVKVERGTPLAEEFLHFVENCSWTEVRDHIAGLVRDWKFTDWETMFAAIIDGKIVGMASLLKTDYYPLPEIFPWVSCVFVEKEFRGNHISGKLIDAANHYAKEQGFTKTYIPTEYTGLYERYGYEYIKDIVNYGGGTDRLYVKTL